LISLGLLGRRRSSNRFPATCAAVRSEAFGDEGWMENGRRAAKADFFPGSSPAHPTVKTATRAQ
jgi:hypothetical protein